MKRYCAKRYRAKQRYRADFFRFFWRDNVSSGVYDIYQQCRYYTEMAIVNAANISAGM